MMICLFTVLLITTVLSDNSKSITNYKTYAEPEDPSPDITANWDIVEPGLNATVGSIDQRYSKSSVPSLIKKYKWVGTAWRGEKVSAQLLLWSKDPIQQVECEFTDFVAENGKIIPAQIARARFVRFVITDEFACGCCDRKPEDFAAFLSADVLDNVAFYNMEGKTTRPVWITIKVPALAEPDIYTSTMKLQSRGQETQTFEFKLEVLPKILPPGTEWKFHLDLWQHPYSVARVNNVELWSDEHWELLKPISKMLADVGQKVITTSINEKPWNTQTQYGFESMVNWKKKKEGTWEYDYTTFDKYVEFMMDLGVKKQINCYSLIPWTHQLVYFDEESVQNDTVNIKPGSDLFVEMWTPFLKDFRVHLKDKGWDKITNYAMDESEAEDMEIMLGLMDREAPEFGIALADNKKSYKRYPDHIKDLCVSYTAGMIDPEDLVYRKEKGYPTTYYLCCMDSFPNTFTFSPPSEAPFIGWYAMAAGFDGFLRWSYTSWPKDPLRDSRFRRWSAGDTYLVYPGARSSIRFERLVEGIQDAEKIRILREEFKRRGTDEARQKLELLNKTVAQFNILSEPESTEVLLNHGKKVLEELSR